MTVEKQLQHAMREIRKGMGDDDGDVERENKYSKRL